MNKVVKKVAVFSLPFKGHIHIVFDLIESFLKQGVDVTFYLTSWPNLKDLNTWACDHVKSLGARVVSDCEMMEPLGKRSTDFDVNLERARTLAPIYKKRLIENGLVDNIIYDHMAIEGYILGKNLGIHKSCSFAFFIGEQKSRHILNLYINSPNNQSSNQYVQEEFGVNVLKEYELLGETIVLYGDLTLCLTVPLFFPGKNAFEKGKGLSIDRLRFLGPRKLETLDSDDSLVREIKTLRSNKYKKLFIVSLGSVIPNELCAQSPAAATFVKKLFLDTCRLAHDNPDTLVVIAIGEMPINFLAKNISENLRVYKFIPQLAILRLSDLFLTHAGSNSAHEAAEIGVPMICVPFFGDQHSCAARLQELGIGRAFLHDESDREAVIDYMSGKYDRGSYSYETLSLWFHELMTPLQREKSQFFADGMTRRDGIDRSIKELIENT